MPSSYRTDLSALLAVTALIFAGCTLEVGEDEGSGLEASVSAMLEASAGGWNDGDLDAFLAIYAESSTTSLVTPGGLVEGLDRIREWYGPAFQPGARRDSMRVEELDIRQLPPLIGVVTGRRVFREDHMDNRSDWFTMVVRRVGDGWRVIHEHPSAEASE